MSQESRDGPEAAAVRPARRRRIAIAAVVLAAATVAAGVGVAVTYNGPPAVRETLAAVGTLGDPAGHQPVYGAAFSPDGTTLATADGFYGTHLPVGCRLNCPISGRAWLRYPPTDIRAWTRAGRD
jgi:hypothetical protein